MISSIFKKLRRFRRDTRANVAMITALCAIPLFGMLGFAVDYGTALSNKAKLDQAADSAAMVAITTATNLANLQGGSFTSPTDVQAAGEAAGIKAFAANAGAIGFAAVPTPSVQVTANPGKRTIQSQVTYSSVAVNTNFSKIIGIKTIPLSGVSTASLKIGTYTDFYLLLDVSGSMGLPTTTAGQAQLSALNPDLLSSFPGGCMFACHFPGYQGYTLTRENNIPLRVDSVESAVCSMISQAITTETNSGSESIRSFNMSKTTFRSAPTLPARSMLSLGEPAARVRRP
jgi:Flp pilus assembly protein TadG